MKEIKSIRDEGVDRVEPDVVGEIWADAEKAGLLTNLRTAESRVKFDTFLRSRCRKIADESLRGHAESIIRDKRSAEFQKWTCDTRNLGRDEAIADLLRRVSELESERR